MKNTAEQCNSTIGTVKTFSTYILNSSWTCGYNKKTGVTTDKATGKKTSKDD